MGPMGRRRKSGNNPPLDQDKIASILGSTHEPVEGDGVGQWMKAKYGKEDVATSEAKHTPGRWILDGEDGFAKVVSEAGWTIAETSHIHEVGSDLGETMHLANMRLISASPDLLAACKRLLECGTPGGSDHGEMVWDAAVSQAKTAIAKAIGK